MPEHTQNQLGRVGQAIQGMRGRAAKRRSVRQERRAARQASRRGDTTASSTASSEGTDTSTTSTADQALGDSPKPEGHLDAPQGGIPPRTQKSRPSDLFGSAPAEGPITTPDIAGLADEALPALREAEDTEIERAEADLADTAGRVASREEEGAKQAEEGIGSVDEATGEVRDIAAAGREEVADLPDRVQQDIQGIADKFKATTDVDVGRIESLGRKAVGLAVAGKNAAAQAAVEAAQASTRTAISQINADPSIPQSRKTAMIAQIQAQSSMQIASVVGSNIREFTAMQTNAMTATMQSVGSALTSRGAVLGQLGSAEINAVSGAHETAATLMGGYDEMSANAVQNAETLRFQYNTLRETARDTNNQTDLQILGEQFYVGGMPVDFQLTDLMLTRDMMGSDFAMQLQSRGYQSMEEAVADGDSWAQQTMLMQTLGQFLPGPIAMALSFLPMGIARRNK